MKVTEDPEQVGLVPDVKAIDTAGTSVVLTVMVILLLVAVVGLAQAELEVITQVTTSLLARVDVVYVEPVATLVPLTFH